ncbi:MAG: transposase [Candidatus Wallbacteria bacterium]|nr:transposase [Candidatus Wallbacteria bacterium]
MSIEVYEADPEFVLQRFREGEFDYVDGANEILETSFFRFLQAKKYLAALAQSYPSPRQKHDVPVWFYVASNLSMRLHGVHAFHAYPYIVRTGGMLLALGPDAGRKVTHPETGDVTLCCEGFNDKNSYDRQTPADQDFLRKFSKDTEPEALEQWFNGDVARLWRQHKLLCAGTFIGDASYVFVPDNERYERSARMLFDEHDHPVAAAELERLSPQAAARCRWRRCYKLVSLVYVAPHRAFSLRVALRLLPGNEHECPVLYELVDRFVAQVGVGVVRRLILDRGFLDGERIAHCKLQHGIDILIPARRNMDVFADVEGLVRAGQLRWKPYQAPVRSPVDAPRLPDAPAPIQRRERRRQKTLRARRAETPSPSPQDTVVRTEVSGVQNTRSWQSCSVPLNVVVCRDIYGDGHEAYWMLLDTKPLHRRAEHAQRRDEYSLRTEIEEGHRQLKCFWDLASFTSRSFSLVLNQVVFVILTANLLQVFLRKHQAEHPERQRRTRTRALQLLVPTASVIIIYCQGRFATLTALEYSELLLTLAEASRLKILDKTRRLRRNLDARLRLARPP